MWVWVFVSTLREKALLHHKKNKRLEEQLISRLSLPLPQLGSQEVKNQVQFAHLFSLSLGLSLLLTLKKTGSGTPTSLVIESILPSQKSCQLIFSIGHYREMLHDTLTLKEAPRYSSKDSPWLQREKTMEAFFKISEV